MHTGTHQHGRAGARGAERAGRWPARRGSSYLLVLGAAALLVTAGLGAIYAAGVRRSSAELGVEGWRARLAAEAGIDSAMQAMNTDASWRTTYKTGAFFTDKAVDGGAFTVTGVDTVDGTIDGGDGDPIQLISTGRSGRARSKLAVTINSRLRPLTCLGVAMCSGGAQNYTSATITNGQTISGNLTVTALLSSVSGRVESAVLVTGLTFTGTIASLTPARELPTAAAFDPYVAAGTSFSIGSVPIVSTRRTLSRVLISPSSSPTGGATNAMGVYVVDCGGVDLDVRDCRIVGTLVILNPGAGSRILGTLHAAPASPNYPSIMVRGSMSLEITSGTSLSEAGPPAVNFNPAGTPYGGVSDADTVDTYPTEIRGIMYVSGNLSTSNHPKVTGNLVVGGTINVGGSLTLGYDATANGSPPPGFYAVPVPMAVVPGSWQQVVD